MHRLSRLLVWTFALFLPLLSAAAPFTLQNNYINPETKRLPEAVIFYNSANPCQNCHKTIDLLITLLKKNYRGKIHAYLIDTARRPEFISAFNLKGPLNLVLIQISDGASFGYRTIPGLQSLSNSKRSLNRRVMQAFKNFLNI